MPSTPPLPSSTAIATANTITADDHNASDVVRRATYIVRRLLSREITPVKENSRYTESVKASTESSGMLNFKVNQSCAVSSAEMVS